MIIDSLPAMTAIDVIIIASALYLIVVFRRYRAAMRTLNLTGAVRLITLGVAAVGLFYLADLLSMHLLPLLSNRAFAMQVMYDLHLNWSWIDSLAALSAICLGTVLLVTRVVPRAAALLHDLESQVAARTRQLENTNTALRQLEQRYRAVFDAPSTGVGVTDANARFLDVNAAMGRMLGYSVDELLGKTAIDVTHPDDVEDSRKNAKQLIDGELDGFQTEKRFLDKQGRTVWVELDVTAVRDEQGNCLETVGMVFDVSRRAKAEASLRASEQRLRDILEVSTDWFWECDTQFTLTELSPRLAQSIGASANAVVGSTTSEILKQYGFRFPADTGDRDAYLQTLAEHRPFRQIEYRRDLADGTVAWFEVSGVPLFDEDGAFLGYRGTGTDISVRKLAAQAMRESESRYRSIFANAPIALFEDDWSATRAALDELIASGVTDLEQHFAGDPEALEALSRSLITLDFNAESLRVYGETDRQSFLDQYPDAAVDEKFVERAVRLLRGETLVTSEGSDWRYDGTRFDARITIHVAPEHAQTWSNVLTIVEDVTERKAADQALRESELRYRHMFELAPISLWEEDLTQTRQLVDQMKAAGVSDFRTHLEANPQARDALYRSVRTLDVNAATLEIYGEPDKARFVQRLMGKTPDSHYYDRLARLAQGETRVTTECVEQRLDDSVFDARMTVQIPSPYAADWSRVLSTVEDVTERTQAQHELSARERQLSILTANLPGIAYQAETGEHWQPYYLSEGTLELTGYTVEELLNLDEPMWPKLVHPDDYEQAMGADWDVQPGVPYHTVFRLQTRTGEWKWMADYGQGVFSDDGELEFVEGIILDITASREQEEQLHHARKLETVGRLTGGISHDFNNLLTIILGNLRILRDEHDELAPSEAAELIGDALSAARDGATLTERLLTFSRRTPQQVQALDLSETITRLQRLMERSVASNVEVRATPFEVDTLLVRADAAQLEAALLNLALNAGDAMAQGGTLTVTTGRRLIDGEDHDGAGELAPGSYATITVADTGTGMTPDVLERALEPFFTTKPAGQGTGLGLSTVYGFAQSSGGTLLIDSSPGKGTRATLLLPEDLTRSPARRREADPAESEGGAETILVVEDTERVRRFAVRSLRKQGYTVLEAANATVALELLRDSRRIDLLFSDVIMPGGVKGDKLAAQARRAHPGLKVILTTGSSRESERLTGNGPRPAHDLLPKPYTYETLLARVRQALDRGTGNRVP